MKNPTDPSTYQSRESEFVAHVSRLLSVGGLRIPTARGRRDVTTLLRTTVEGDHAVDLKRMMVEMGRPDRELESRLPTGKFLEVTLSRKKFLLFKSPQARLNVVGVSPIRELIGGTTAGPMNSSDVAAKVAQISPPPSGVAWTVIIVSTGGFTDEAIEKAKADVDHNIILAGPSSSAGGGWVVAGPARLSEVIEALDPETDAAKRRRIQEEIEAGRADLLSSGLSAERIARRTNLPAQFVEAELKSHARLSPGLTVKRLDGNWVLFRESAATLPLSAAATGGIVMPLLDRMRTLFSRKGEVEKKIAFLAERRAALGQQRDHGYEDISALEGRESELRQQFKEAGGEITRRRITSQLLQLRKDVERKNQLLSVLNQQINVVSTHLHNLELQKQGRVANLPDGEEMARDAAAAEEVLAELTANNEFADSVSGSAGSGMSAEEQALYDELLGESAAAPESPAAPASNSPTATAPIAPASVPPKKDQSSVPPRRERSQPEPG